MKFSILISSYNKGDYLEDCLNSCLKQSYKNYEIILIDNYSTDNTKYILKKYSKKIKILKKKKVSTYPQMNQIDLLVNAFKVSKGSIICLLDADDLFNPNKLSHLKKLFKSKKKTDVLFDLALIQKNGIKRKFKLKKKMQKYIWPTIINTSSISMRRKFFQKCLKEKIFNKFNLLEIDFRITVLAMSILKNYYITKENLTIYVHTKDGIISKIKKYSKKWWTKRSQAHDFMKHIYLKHDKTYENKIDLLSSKILSKLTI
tara:strand:- start:68 stop:844 length:777 start_codon:yes stop_codon:yes gene_type:complete